MTLYHISLEVEKIAEVFIPKVPSATYEHENNEIPRICLSDNIEGCLSSVPFGGRKLEHVVVEFNDLVEVNEDSEDMDYSLVFRVYEFEKEFIPEVNFISTEELLKQGLVMDAGNSNEVWVVNQELKPAKTYLALLTSYDEEMADIYSVECNNFTEEDWDEVEDMDDLIIGASTKIINTTLNFYPDLESIPLTIDWESWKNLREEMRVADFESSF